MNSAWVETSAKEPSPAFTHQGALHPLFCWSNTGFREWGSWERVFFWGKTWGSLSFSILTFATEKGECMPLVCLSIQMRVVWGQRKLYVQVLCFNSKILFNILNLLQNMLMAFFSRQSRAWSQMDFLGGHAAFDLWLCGPSIPGGQFEENDSMNFCSTLLRDGYGLNYVPQTFIC